jgi:hypothetical protein
LARVTPQVVADARALYDELHQAPETERAGV